MSISQRVVAPQYMMLRPNILVALKRINIWVRLYNVGNMFVVPQKSRFC